MTTLAPLQLSPTARDFERNLRKWVAAGSGLADQDVIPGETDGPAPNGLYASVILITPRIVGLPYVRRERNEDGIQIDQDTIALVRDRYAIQWHRSEVIGINGEDVRIHATDVGRQFTVWASSPKSLELAAEKGFTLHRVTDIRPLDEIDRGGKWEERIGVEVDVGYTQHLVQPLNPIEIINIDIYHDDDAGNVSETIEVQRP